MARANLAEASATFEDEVSRGAESGDHLADEFGESDLSTNLIALWQAQELGEDVADGLSQLRKKFSRAVDSHPIGASLVLLHRLATSALGEKGAENEALKLCRRYPDDERVWQTARRVYDNLGKPGLSQLSALMASKLRHGSQPGPTGSYVVQGALGTKVLVGLVTESGPLVLALEADVGRGQSDQLFGWGREALLPGLGLAKGVLEHLAENRGSGKPLVPELSFFPQSFRVMVTPLSVPGGIGPENLSMSGELSSIPLGFLVALLSVLKEPPVQRVTSGRPLGLERGYRRSS